MALIECRHLTHVYLKGTPLEAVALQDVTLSIEAGEFVGLIGPTGSGKSTLIQHLNALLRPTGGEVRVAGINPADARADVKTLRQQVGLVFQYPEHQLFEETVYDDVAYGPRNLGLTEDQVRERVGESLALVGVDPGRFGRRSPFSLSGGEMRRVAIAGVLAMRPRVLVLDEPAAGLDPKGKEEILGQIRTLHEAQGLTVLLVTHSMDEAAQLVKRLVVLARGQIVMDGPVREIFRRAQDLTALGLGVPAITALMLRLRSAGMAVTPDVLTVDEARAAIGKVLQWN
ncbi:MAG: energy-coupling factor transporter ATPase [Bacillati bacterium ANGP1]|uniref:Energy-coupling factor transporter ATP-binding protein EcfA2 n=1 Tax=Candidatus Segetimicrobium genomatis TaxID=2569760 RepID=A0A537LBI2_9BACT|nr:MAG: energy-coupling factor transporter ATPase [Armatimonadetes bacterium 13_1_40CM_3_65_7]TMJ05047.1 MAG: energy-coupling factor transporter ATPase [Terrabacteria group bacterium ANGP1]TMJ09065.1 MAG: energy-coupling factor transporter ATPase [Terrabacteria group bacterium ANGP1]